MADCDPARLYTVIAESKRAGVTGTPAFYINGRMLAGAQPIEAFVMLIEAELARGADDLLMMIVSAAFVAS